MKPSTSSPPPDPRAPRPPASTSQPLPPSAVSRRTPVQGAASPSSSRPALPGRPQFSSYQHIVSPLAQQPSNISPPVASPRSDAASAVPAPDDDTSAVSPGTTGGAVSATGGHVTPPVSKGISRPNRPHFGSEQDAWPAAGALSRAMSGEKRTQQVSPSLRAAFDSPNPAGPATASTDSAESTHTVRALPLQQNPSARQVRTPSYPFPYVLPHVPRSYPGPTHQPFTALSPTTQSPLGRGPDILRDRFHSVSSTPGDPGNLNYPGYAAQMTGDERFPIPNLYDLILQVNAEPSLEAWWDAVANIAHTWYKAERAHLSLPADPSDIENVPWGLKAAWNIHGLNKKTSNSIHSGRSNSVSSVISYESGSRKSTRSDPKVSPANTSSRKPRQSFAGSHGDSSDQSHATPSQSKCHSSSRKQKPATSRRTSSDRVASSGSGPENSYISPEFDSVSGVDAVIGRPTSAVFQTLQPLEYESETLLDTTSVNRILERNKLAILTREYATPLDERGPTGGGPDDDDDVKVAPHEQELSDTNQRVMFSRTGIIQEGTGSSQNVHSQYEEYEQGPLSPWAQSPAPSPAIQADPDENPFFTSDSVEAAFSPDTVKEDYSEYGAVEAIGVDKASTIIHLPIIHPYNSWTLGAAMNEGFQTQPGKPEARAQHDNTQRDSERRAPIAILTLYCRVVPYPRDLQDSIRAFSPHLANSLNTSLQVQVMQNQMLARQTALARMSGKPGGGVTNLGLGLDDLLHVDAEDGASSTTFGSIASPSEYSAKSRASPGGSLLGTPGIDTALISSNKPSRGNTPGTAPLMEPSDSYFEPKKRIPIARSKSTHAISHVERTSPRTPQDHRATLGRIDEPVARSSEQQPKTRPYSWTDTRPLQSSKPEDRPREHMTEFKVDEARHSPEQPTRRSLLHSYGADFNASFQILPTATGLYHGRNVSTADVYDMPPPSEKLLRTIIDALPVQIFTAAPHDGRITWVNSKFLVYRGHGQKQVLDDPWETIHPEDADEYLESWRRCLEAGVQFQRKVRIRRFDDIYRWFYVRTVPLRDKKQNIVHWIGTYVDFHEQHLAESNAAKQQETAASEAKYRALANSSPQIVFAATRSRGITFCNTQWLEYSGQTEQNTLKVGFLEMVHPDDIVKCKLPIFTGQRPNVPVSVSMPSKPHRSASGMSGSDANSEASAESNITVHGYSAASPTDLPQRKLSELASVGILKISRDSSGKPSYSTEVRLRSKSGEYRWHLVRVLLAEPIISEENQEETWYGSCADINDHKELESQLKETMDAKSRFLSNMSHEIRTPLHGIHGMTNMLMDTRLTEEQMDQVNTIRASAEGLRDLINDILDLSKVEAGMIVLNKDWLDIRAIIEEVDDLTVSLATDKGLELNYIVDDDIPVTVKGDRFRIRQVLLNTIGNAIKFTEHGEVLVRCQLVPESDPAAPDSVTIKFSIHDTGKGFNEKEAERLFKRFSQIDASSTRQHGGSGLGLVISMQLVELHGGHMSATSSPGRGSTFSFTLEVGVAVEEGSRRASSGPTLNPFVLGGSPQPAPSPRILGDIESQSLEGSVAATVQASGTASKRSSASSIAALSEAAQKELLLRSPSVSESSSPESTPGNLLPLAQTSSRPLRAVATQARAAALNVLVVADLPWTRVATTKHLERVLLPGANCRITACDGFLDAMRILAQEGTQPAWTHVVAVVPQTDLLTSLVARILRNRALAKTSIIVISSLTEKKQLVLQESGHDFEQLARNGRMHFVFKPLKPSKLSTVFDPEKSRVLTAERSQHAAAVENQRQLFNEMTERLGNRDLRVLVVEDNPVNQKLLMKLLQRVSLKSETAVDGVECLKRFHSKPLGYYAIILCDLHMPNKDGYQTCSEIRQWERDNHKPHTPIVALSANVLGDVEADCKRAGFDSFLTKPIEFKDFSDVLTKLLDGMPASVAG